MIRRFSPMRFTVVLCGLIMASLSLVCPVSMGSVQQVDVWSGSLYSQFGTSMAMDGDIVVVGAPSMRSSGSPTGAAFVYNAATGEQLDVLHASDATYGYGFGASVGFDGSRAIVGAPDDGRTGTPAAYVFNTSTGAMLAKLSPAGAESGDGLGRAVAIDGYSAVLGARFQNSCDGAAYVFDLVTGRETKLMADTTRSFFGYAVAVADGVVLVGAPFDNAQASNPGAVYAFDAVSGRQIGKFARPDGLANPDWSFGVSIAVDDGLALIGSQDEHSGQGAAYLFDIATGAFLQRLVPGDAKDSQRFGNSVALSDGVAVVGSVFDGPDVQYGAAYVFDVMTGETLDKIVHPDPFEGMRFGSSVAISGDRLLCGASYDHLAGSTSGSVYVYNLPEPTTSALLVGGGLALLRRRRS